MKVLICIIKYYTLTYYMGYLDCVSLAVFFFNYCYDFIIF